MEQTPVLSSVYQLRIVLRGISPLIWRRLLIPSRTTIADLHGILQTALGWEDDHLHRFCVHGKDYGIAYVGGLSFADNPRAVRLSDFRLRCGERFLYVYNFTANWEHDIRLEAVLTPSSRSRYPVCTGGGRAAPPEECPGPWAYLEALGQRRCRPCAVLAGR